MPPSRLRIPLILLQPSVTLAAVVTRRAGRRRYGGVGSAHTRLMDAAPVACSLGLGLLWQAGSGPGSAEKDHKQRLLLLAVFLPETSLSFLGHLCDCGCSRRSDGLQPVGSGSNGVGTDAASNLNTLDRFARCLLERFHVWLQQNISNLVPDGFSDVGVVHLTL